MSVKNAFIIALLYAVFSALWILFSDMALLWLVQDPQRLTEWQTYKGWAFVVGSAALIYLVAYRSFQQFEQLYQSDPLTKLLRHYRFQLYLEDMLKDPHKGKDHVLLMEIDIDEFKHLNSKLGYEQADRFLQLFGRRLQEHYTADTLIARTGTDRFLIAKRQLRISDEVIDEEFEEVNQIVAVTAAEFGVSCTVCIGLALSPRDGHHVKELLAAVTTALNHARLNGPGTARVHNAALSEQQQKRQLLHSRLQTALKTDGLSLVYQPQFDTRTERLTGCEVLVRWNDAQLGYVSPEVFIQLAEQYGLINQITQFVLTKAYQELQTSELLNNEQLPRVSINLSALEFSNAGLMETLVEIVRHSPGYAERLQFEITESAALSDMEGSVQLISRYKQEGLRFSIDDFGTGYSSLAVLKDLPVDELKIDRGFIDVVLNQPKSAAIVESVIHMARSFNMSVVAEGVETAEQLQRLRKYNCDEVQGFYLAKPMKVAELKKFLNDSANDKLTR